MARRLSVAYAILLMVGGAGCATSPETVTSTPAPVSDSMTTAAPTSTESTAPQVSTSTVPTTSATTIPDAADAPTTVPSKNQRTGESYDFGVPVPSEGAILGVVGVWHDDTLNVRGGPDVTFDVIATLAPDQTGIAGAGEGWLSPSGSVWWKVEAGEGVGWANQQFLSRMGDVDDLTSFVVGDLGGIPDAETMVGLGLIVVSTFAEEDSGASVVVSVEPTIGDLGEVTYDVIGLRDDSVGGYRLHIFGQPIDDGGFSLMAVEVTPMCLRGVGAGQCI